LPAGTTAVRNSDLNRAIATIIDSYDDWIEHSDNVPLVLTYA